MTGAVLPPVADAEMAARFFETWFDKRDDTLCVLSSMLPGLKKQARHKFLSAAEWTQGMREIQNALDGLIYESGINWNLYMGVGTLKEKPDGARKGGRADIAEIPGVWVDLDTDKDGFFADENACLDFLRSLEKLPSIVVATGTGGVHAYWKTSRWMSGSSAEKACESWWAWLREQAAGPQIDKLTNADRLMKLPGSVRWPKHEGEGATLVRLLYADANVMYSRKELAELSDPAWARYTDGLQRRQARLSEGRTQATYNAAELTGWDLLLALQDVEQHFNESYTWQDILVPLGWTEIGKDADDRTIWARPGLAAYELHKSAATDYQDSQAMSLFSDSIETGLQELNEMGVPLTKYRVYVERVWGGDEAGFVQAYAKEHFGGTG